MPNVIYWPSTEPSTKRCTCVNKRKNSGSSWTADNNITSCPGRFELIGDKMPKWEPAANRGLWALSDPWLSNPSQDEKKVLLWSREKVLVNIAVCSRLQLISHTQPTSTLLRIKCDRYIFIKKCIRSFIEVRHYVWLCSAYICITVYNTKLNHCNNIVILGTIWLWKGMNCLK